MADFQQPLGIGVDVGGSSVRTMVFDEHLEPQATWVEPTDARRLGAQLSEMVEKAVDVIAEKSGQGRPLVGVGIPGRVTLDTGQVTHAVNLGIGADEFSVVESLRDTGVGAVHVVNDVNAAALGAAHWLGPEQQNLAVISVGTGIATGVVLRGEIVSGHSGFAGEIGHVPIDPAGTMCPCGQIGCLENFASARAFRTLAPESNGSATSLLALKEAGEPNAQIAWTRLVFGLAWATQTVSMILDLDCVVLGGGVAKLGRILLDDVKAELDRRAADSLMLRSLDLSQRLQMAPPEAPLGAVGALIAAQINEQADD